MNAATPTIINQAITTGAEVAVTLPTSTKKLLIKSREVNGDIKLSFTAGGTASNYVTIGPNVVYNEEEILTNASLYLKAATTNCTVEIIAWS